MKYPFRILLLISALLGQGVLGNAAEDLRIDADTAVSMALEASSLSRAAEDRVEAGQSALRAADAAAGPSLDINAALVHQSAVPEFTAPINGPTQPPTVIFPSIREIYSAELRISQPIYTGGAISAGRDAAASQEAAARWAQELSVLNLSRQARSLYWSAVAAVAGVEAAEATVERNRRMLSDARALREAGMAVRADVLAAQARVSAAEVELIRAENEAKQSRAALRSLLGIAEDFELEDVGADTIPSPPAALAKLQEEALATRPEPKISEAGMEGLEAGIRRIRSSLKPTIAASGQYFVAQPNQRYLPLEDVFNDSWQIGIAATWRFFDSGRRKEEAVELEAQRRASGHEREELERRIRLEVQQEMLEMQSALDAASAADISLNAAKAWEEASRERYEAGLATLTELMDAQTHLTAAEVARIRSRAAAWIADAALQRALGR